jgi:hypothetical protein
MVIEKTQAGAAAFSWSCLYVEDSAGNRYLRSDKDSFLESYGYGRIKSTDLTLGTNEGYICFEIPTSASEDKMTLKYESDESLISIPLN